MINVIEKATGEKKVAVYANTPAGNKRYNVDGKFYTDKNFDKTFGIIPKEEKTVGVWQSHVKALFEEVLNNPSTQILRMPLQITLGILAQIAKHGAEVKDEKLIGYCSRLALYEFSDPYSKEFDQERKDYYVNKTK